MSYIKKVDKRQKMKMSLNEDAHEDVYNDYFKSEKKKITDTEPPLRRH